MTDDTRDWRPVANQLLWRTCNTIPASGLIDQILGSIEVGTRARSREVCSNVHAGFDDAQPVEGDDTGGPTNQRSTAP